MVETAAIHLSNIISQMSWGLHLFSCFFAVAETQDKKTTANVKCCLWVIPEQKWIFSNIDEAKIDFSFELWKYKKLLSDYFPSANCTLLETPFYTLIDVLKNLKLRLWNSHTVSWQKQEPVVGQSIETSLLGSLASNLLGCSCEGHTFYHSTCSKWYIQPAPAEAQRHTHTTTRFNTLALSYHLFLCLPIKYKHIRFSCYFTLAPCFPPAPPDELSHVRARMPL